MADSLRHGAVEGARDISRIAPVETVRHDRGKERAEIEFTIGEWKGVRFCAGGPRGELSQSHRRLSFERDRAREPDKRRGGIEQPAHHVAVNARTALAAMSSDWR